MAISPKSFQEPQSAAPGDVTQSPAFQAALEAALEAKLEKAVARLEAKFRGTRPASEGSPLTKEVMEEFIFQMTDRADAGSERVRQLRPEEKARREEKRREALALIRKAHDERKTVIYRLTTVIYDEDQIIEPLQVNKITKQHEPVFINYYKMPSEGMAPANATAEAIFAAYRESLGFGPKVVDEGLPYIQGNLLFVPPSRISAQGLEELERAKSDTDAASLPEYLAPSESGREVRLLGTIAPPAIQAEVYDSNVQRRA